MPQNSYLNYIQVPLLNKKNDEYEMMRATKSKIYIYIYIYIFKRSFKYKGASNIKNE